jgi:hypothetical protein
MDYHELKHKTVAELREIAAGLEGLTGYTQMRKEQVLEAICRHQGIEMHAHHVVAGIDKASIKQSIRALKAKRDEAIAAHDGIALKRVRRKIHRLKRELHRATV